MILFRLARESNEPDAPDNTFTQRGELAMSQAARALLHKTGEQS
jgi:hypothetical protein